MKIRVRDLQAREEAWEKQGQLADECPYAVPNYIPFVDISCYREIETDKLYIDRGGNLHYS